MKHIKTIALILTLALNPSYAQEHTQPKLTVILVIDQFAHHILKKIEPHLKGGIAWLLNKGTVYTNAYFPHAVPRTSVGHVALNTGTYAKDHGIVNNAWFDNNNNKIACDDDATECAAVLAPDGFYPYGKSACKIKVDGISDQFVQQSQPEHKQYADQAIPLFAPNRKVCCRYE